VIFKSFTDEISVATFNNKNKAIAFAIELAGDEYQVINYPLAKNGCTIKTCDENIEVIRSIINKPYATIIESKFK